MRRFIVSLILIMGFATGASAVKADVPDGTMVDAVLVRHLMDWVEAHTHSHVPALPQVIASHDKFRKILRGMGIAAAGQPRSLYVPGTVLLSSLSWDPDEPTQVSLLVHELVHHAQLFMTDTVWTCPNAREQQAYDLQNQWLAEQGHEPFVQAAWITRVSACAETEKPIFLAQTPAE